MFSSLLDYLCSRPFPEAPRWRWRLRALLWAAAFGVLAFAVGWALSGDFAVPGENTTALAALSGSPVVMDFIGPRNVLGASHPLLWSLVGLFGAAPTMGALNLLGAAVMGVIVALTWLLVRFWCLDGGGEETSTLRLARRAWFASGAVCLAFLFSLPGLYGATTLTFNAWGFMLLLLCAVLQNVYAMSGGRRRLMVLASVVLGACAVETPWVLALVPFFFLRAVVAEWRLWDHSARNLTFWFVGFVAGAAAVLLLATWRVTGGFSPFAVWGVEREVLEHVFLPTVMGWVAGPWLLNVAGAVALPLVAWGVARALLANTRSLGLLIGGVVVTGCAFGLQWGLIPLSPWVNWLAMGGQPLAVGWMGALACGMLAAGWGVQLLARASTMHQDPDTRRELPLVRAGRIVGGVCLAATVAALAVTCGVQTHRFLKLDRAMATRFAEETVGPLQEQGRTYLLGSRTGWIDPHLALVAQARGVPLTLFCPARMEDKAYLEALRRQLETDWDTGCLVATVEDKVCHGGVNTLMLNVSFACHMPDCLEMPYKPTILGTHEPADGEKRWRMGGNSCLAGDYYGDWAFDGGREPEIGEKIVFRDMLHYTMVKTTMFNGVTHPSIGIWNPQTGFRLVRRFGYEDYKNRMS